ncbi:MAG: GAF domain-containing protein [Pegethrix bostrychoides GSE-TBD4-15B]|jgi:twitching motility protein PilJ/methyl-accepting chemotaxis protein PixJ|uniref:GAF domain-containing protein n=1 Tax=Pegethrix bostrychoides GSE-TBD4-15B TaxID=2839662 RepID=A0A951PF33_9CYAN|nr:GAF domain-containing protein [Pegethrix bostrychoides GSE-TBD4-15B]
MTQNLPKPNFEFSNGQPQAQQLNGKTPGKIPGKAPAKFNAMPDLKSAAVEPVRAEIAQVNEAAQPARNTSAQGLSRWRKLSLKNKATTLAILLGTLPVILIGGTSYFLASQSLSNQITAAQQDSTAEVLDKVAFYMRERYGDIQIMSNLNVFTDTRQRLTATRQEKQVALDQFLQAYPIYNSVAVFDLNGNVLAQSQGAALDNHKNRNYFQTVLKTGQSVISEPQVSKSSGILSIHTAAPVKDKATGQIIGVVRARLPVSNLHDLLATISEGHEGENDAGIKLYLSDRNGNLFAGSDPSYKDLATPVAGATLFPGFDAMTANQQNGINLEGGQVITRATMPKYTDLFRVELPDLGWSTVATVDQQVAFAAQRELLLALLAGTALAAVAVGALAAWIANRATRPLLDAATVTEKIGQGDLSSRLNVTGEDELAVLGGNINTMAARLQDILQEQAGLTDQASFLTSVTANTRAASGDIDQLFDQALAKSRQFLGLERMVIYRFKSDWSGYISNESVADGFPKALEDKIEDPCIPQVLLDGYLKGRVVPTNDVFNANFHPEHLELMERLHIRANLVAPIVNQGQLFGLLVAHHCTQTHEWKQSETIFVSQLAAQLGISIAVQEVETARMTAETLATEQTELKESLQRRALELLMAVDPVSHGDLTVRANVTEDEIGTVADSYNATISSLRKIVLQVQEAAQQVVSTTNSNESAVRDLSTGALQQTTEITAALAQIQEMANSIQQVSNSAQQAETAVQQATQTVQAGDAAMNRTVEGILAIRETVGETAKKVKRLGESSQKISKVVNLIGTFAAQTNLLALNASIEAARAGEEGRGFAVVADEVRSLARQSAEATAEIEKLVASIQAETNEVVAAMESGTEQVVMGTQLVDETRQNLTQIAAVSTQINDLVRSIAQAAQMQSKASESVTQTMTGVATIADQNSAEAIQVSDSFKQLLDVAQSLQTEVGQFKVR